MRRIICGKHTNDEKLYLMERLLVIQIDLYYLFLYDNHMIRLERLGTSEALKYFLFWYDYCKVGFNSMQTFPLLV